MSGIGLLASYPRSGNTWMRAVLTALVNAGRRFDINALEGKAASDRSLVDEALEIETSDLLPEEAHRLRPQAYRFMPAPRHGRFPLKTHDAWLPAANAVEPPFPRERIDAVVLLVRDPRDIALSLARYYGLAIDDAIDWMSRGDAALSTSRKRLRPQLEQLVSSWSGHAASWLNAGLPLTVVRYEDLIADPQEGCAAIAGAFGFAIDPDGLAAAIAETRLDVLRAAEARTAFREASPNAPNGFFGSGPAMGWRGALTDAQAERIVHDHGTVMRTFGYDL